MDHMKILKRAWRILWSYRALWVFGIIVALTTTSGNAPGSRGYQFDSGDNNMRITPPAEIERELEQLGEGLGALFERLFDEGVIGPIAGGVIALLVGLCGLMLLLGIIFTIARYVSENALIRMVDDHEATGERRTVRQGFGLGWSRPAWRFFLIDLVVTIPVIVVIILLFAIAAAPLLLWITEVTALGIFGTVATVGLGLLAILITILVAILVGLLLKFARRSASLEDLGVFEAIARGFDVLKSNLGTVGMMWLIMVGVGIVQAIVTIPLVLISIAAGALFGGLFLLLGRGIAGIFTTGTVSWIIGAVLAVPVFFLTIVAPLGFLGGLFQTFQSTVWTLSYRELTIADAAAGETPTVEPPTSSAALKDAPTA
ncbi:MAG: DUF7544 domain-containing protein [Anaerolineae bacterium]